MMSHNEHIDLDVLEEYLLGKLDEKESEAVRRHLARCTLCGLELKRLERFLVIDDDEDLSREAAWGSAERKLETAFKERIVPEAGVPPARVARFPRGTRLARWLVPVAAAAGVALLISHFSMRNETQAPLPGSGVMRGAPAAVEYGIELEAPAGEIEEFSGTFRWSAKRRNARYLLEIFTPNLDRVHLVRNITDTTWTAPDSIKATLEPNVIYLWSVRGYEGLEHPVVSPNGWFRIKR